MRAVRLTTPVGYADSPLPAEAEPEHKKSGAGVAQPTPLPRSRKIGRKEGYSLFVVGDGQVVVTALRSSLPQVR